MKSFRILYSRPWQSCCHLQHVYAYRGMGPESSSRAWLQITSFLFEAPQVTASGMKWTQLLPVWCLGEFNGSPGGLQMHGCFLWSLETSLRNSPSGHSLIVGTVHQCCQLRTVPNSTFKPTFNNWQATFSSQRDILERNTYKHTHLNFFRIQKYYIGQVQHSRWLSSKS